MEKLLSHLKFGAGIGGMPRLQAAQPIRSETVAVKAHPLRPFTTMISYLQTLFNGDMTVSIEIPAQGLSLGFQFEIPFHKFNSFHRIIASPLA